MKKDQDSDRVVLLVASGGGHLRELYEFAYCLPVSTKRVWAVPLNALSRDLLAEETVLPIHYNGPRSLVGVLRNSVELLWRTRCTNVTFVLSTGANHAIAAVPLALLRRIPYAFIDSAARQSRTSETGKFLSNFKFISLFCQYKERAVGRWQFISNVFDGFTSLEVQDTESKGPLNVVVTVGAMEDIGFDRLVQACLRVIPNDASVTWQIGPSLGTILSFSLENRFMGNSQLQRKIREADVVISHAGVGSALSCLVEGKVPILIPRLSNFGEHVDDHQVDIADFLGRQGLAIVATPETLSSVHLEQAQRYRARRTAALSPAKSVLQSFL